MSEILSFNKHAEIKLKPREAEAQRRFGIVRTAVADLQEEAGAKVLMLSGPCYFDAMNDPATTVDLKERIGNTSKYLLNIFDSAEFKKTATGRDFVELIEMAFQAEDQTGLINVAIPIRAMMITIVLTRFRDAWQVTNIFFNERSVHQALLKDFMKDTGVTTGQFFNNEFGTEQTT